MKNYKVISLVIVILMTLSVGLSAAEIQFITLSDSEMKFPVSINTNGTVIVGENAAQTGAVWRRGEGTENIGGRTASGVGDNGVICGTIINEDGNEEAAYFIDGTWTPVGTIPGGVPMDSFLSTFNGISDNGEHMAGMAYAANSQAEAFAYNTTDGVIALGQYEEESGRANAVSNDGTIVAGWSRTSGTGRRPAYWQDGEIIFINEAEFGDIMNMTSDGSVFVGSSGNAFIYSEENGFEDLGMPAGAMGTIGLGISDDLTVVGTIKEGMTPNFWRAMIKTADGEMAKITDYFSSNYEVPEDFNNYTLLQANAISADGKTISGFGMDEAYNWVTWIIQIPNADSGTIEGTVTLDGGNGDVSNALVNVNGNTVQTDENGNYSFEILEGTYNASAHLFGYESDMLENIVVEPNETTSGVDFTLTNLEETVNPVQNVEVSGDTGLVAWDASPEGFLGNISWDTGEYSAVVGLQGGGEWDYAHYWDTPSLVEFTGGYINQVQFVPTAESASYTFKIWGLDNSVLYEQELTNLSFGGWTTVDLEIPYQIDATTPIYIGFSVNQVGEDFPAGHDAGPVVNGRGNMINYTGQWESLPFDWNFNINAIAVDAAGRSFNIPANNPKNETIIKEIADKTDFIHENKDRIDRPVSTYNVYLDDMTNPVAENITDTSYQLDDLEEETDYIVGVSAVYENGEESEIVTKNFTYLWEPEHFDPMNLEVNEETGLFSWEVPAMWMHYDNGTSFDGIGLEESDGDNFGIAVRWDQEQLTDYANSEISKVKFYALSDAVDYEIKVWNGNDVDNNEIYSQMVESYDINAWNTVALDESISVTGSEEIWVGLWIHNCPVEELVASGDEGPAVAGFGDKIFLPNYGVWYNLSQFGFDYNWNIQALFEADDSGLSRFAMPTSQPKAEELSGLVNSENPMSSRAQEITSYNVYLDGEMVAENITEMEYTFETLVSGESYTAGVEAIYTDGDSDIITIDFTFNGQNSANEVVSVNKLIGNYPNPFNPTTEIAYQIKSDSKVKIEIYNIAGQKVKTLVNEDQEAGVHKVIWNGKDNNNRNAASGVYFYKLKTNSFNSVKKMILMK